MIVHLVDGTYELFRQFYGRKRFEKPETKRYGAVIGVLHSLLEMIEGGATHLGVALEFIGRVPREAENAMGTGGSGLRSPTRTLRTALALSERRGQS